jgi:hypothetical protein
MTITDSIFFVRPRRVVPALVFIISFLVAADVNAVTAVSNAENFHLGLYKVKSRICQNPIKMSDDCPDTQYIELVKHIFYGESHEQIAFVVWMASKPAADDYTYNSRPLRGHFVKPGEYVIDETPQDKEWFTVSSAGVIREHWYVRLDSDARKKVFKRTHLTLTPVSRDDRLNQPAGVSGAGVTVGAARHCVYAWVDRVCLSIVLAGTKGIFQGPTALLGSSCFDVISTHSMHIA